MTTLRSVLMFCSLVWMVGCDLTVKELEELAKEGTVPGDCSDGADSDEDSSQARTSSVRVPKRAGLDSACFAQAIPKPLRVRRVRLDAADKNSS